MQTGQPTGIITEADISRAVADGKNPNDVRIYELMTANPTVVNTTASIRDAAKIMTSKRFRHLPVMGDAGLAGIRRVLQLQEETRQLQAELARLRELTGARPAPAERSRKQRTR